MTKEFGAFGLTQTETGWRETTRQEYKEHQIKRIKGWLQRSRVLHKEGYIDRAHFWLNEAARNRAYLANKIK